MSTPARTNPEVAVSYAALILADESIPITPEKLQALLKAAGIENVEPIWTTLYARALEGKQVKDIITTAAAAGGAPVVKTHENEDGDGDGDGDVKTDCGNREEIEGSDEDGDFGIDLFG
jgi:large subunit ribosomal protein LP1